MERHVLGISGGRDSAALAVYMRQTRPDLALEYFFTDTGKELPEVYEFLGRLEGFLGAPIQRLNPDRDFDFWLREYNNFLPSPRTRWCTRQLKLRPFERWVRPDLDAGVTVYSYVAIRADENHRQGLNATHPNLKVVLPLREHGIDKRGVVDLLDTAGVGLPEYYRWRSRSGCTFCFFQQKIEWVHLMSEHPDAFEEAKRYEKNALDHGSPFTWSDRESLEELARPQRVEQIQREYRERQNRLQARRRPNALRPDELPSLDVFEDDEAGCLVCHK
ncbi:MAG TPA: phosphoadenosine phosphosulfate reductase family protein [Rhizomicrobium sp.]|jgi:3'-phosphoadenosine 5'-phosphosulfate sulfotransferase (PAPS reductase)/FAD synthetase